MINIILNNSKSRVIGLSPAQLKWLQREVCYFNMSLYIRTRNHAAARMILIDANGMFPTGLLTRVKKWLYEKSISHQVIDNRIIPTGKLLKLECLLEEPPIYPEQELAANILANNPTGTVEIATGVGKTRIIKELIMRIPRPTLVITPSTNLKHQTFIYLKECFGSKFVGMIDDSTAKPITVTNYHAIKSMDPRFFDKFEMVIFDEYHNAANETMREIDSTHFSNIYHKYGLTATNFKNDDNANILLECVLSDQLYSFSTMEAINKGYIVPVVPVFKNLLNEDLVSQGDYRKDFKKFMDLNEEKNAIAIQNAMKMQANNIPTIILVEHIEHGRYIADSIPGSIFINGQDAKASENMKVINMFNEMKIPTVVGTSVIGEGVNTKSCGAFFNLAGGKAKSELMQRVGRVVRKFPGKGSGFYFDWIDNKQKNLLAHSKVRKEIIEEIYGIKVKMV